MDAPPPTPTSYLLIGPPDLLHDIKLDFEEVGWRCDVVRWQAVVTAPEEEHGHPAPDWPAEVTLAGVEHGGHAAACGGFLA